MGRNPDGICVQNEKLYISNSGGLDYSSGLVGVDNTVSVVDIATFKESSKLTVGPNPGKIVAGPDETVYVATRGEDVEAGDYNFVKIDCRTNKVTQSNEKVQNFAIDGEIAYLYNYNYNTQTSSIKMFNLKTEETIRENFITDGTVIKRHTASTSILTATMYISPKPVITPPMETYFVSTNKDNSCSV